MGDRLDGRLLGKRYRIGHLIGAGAMGVVYAAEHVELGRPCAVKVIREWMGRGSTGGSPSKSGGQSGQRATGAPDAVARFRVEARAASRLDHPNLVRVLDFGDDEDLRGGRLYFLVTEHLEGEDLIEVLDTQAVLSTERAIDIARQLCAGLAHCHERGVVHRDVKPENIRLVPRETDDGTTVQIVKLLDFGTAQIDGVPPDTLVIGTPAYMSPEQAAGEPGDHRSDLYSCGVLLFEMITGRLPFEGRSATELAGAHLERRPPRPSALNPDVDRELESIILWCLRKRPTERPQSARELRGALDRIVHRTGRRLATGTFPPGVLARGAPLRGDPISTTVREPVRRVEHRRSMRTRRPASAPTLLTLLAAAGLASAAWLAIGTHQSDAGAPQTTEVGPREAPPPREDPPARPAAPAPEAEPARELSPHPAIAPPAPRSQARRVLRREDPPLAAAPYPPSLPRDGAHLSEDADPYAEPAPLAHLDAAPAPAAARATEPASAGPATSTAKGTEPSPAWPEADTQAGAGAP